MDITQLTETKNWIHALGHDAIPEYVNQCIAELQGYQDAREKGDNARVSPSMTYENALKSLDAI